MTRLSCWAAFAALFLFAGSLAAGCARLEGESHESPEAAVALGELGMCTNTETACTTDSECQMPCGVGTCEASLGNRCRICAQDPGFVCRAATDVCDAVEACDGTSFACPTDRAVTSGTTCRPAVAGGCDQAEVCNGVAPACPLDGFRPSGTSCRAAVGPCDAAETCSGMSAVCPADAIRGAGFVCRAAVAGGCDIQEICDGVATTCPADAFVAGGTMCRAVAGVCDVADSCTGTSATCTDTRLPAGTSCRPSAGVCDPAETCTGSAAACPADVLSGTSTTCRPSVGGCDIAETCSGASAACPGDVLRASGFTCRVAVTGCDLPEFCTGSSGVCPAATGAVRPAGTSCRASGSACDRAEVCDGVTDVCPFDGFQPAGTVCRAAASVCDVVDTCNGTNAACPDVVAPAGGVCRAAGGVCDIAEVCTGTSGTCPTNVRVASGTICNPSTDLCDGAERCTGTSDTCPANILSPSGTICRGAVAPCDRPETCNGTVATCPADTLQPAGALCRAAVAGGCDVSEFCAGTTSTCPPDLFSPAGTECRAAAGTCDRAELCTGTATCPANTFLPAATVCRASTGPCDTAEACAGSGALCPSDGSRPNGTSCDSDSDVCNGSASCLTGVCGAPTGPLMCDDHNPCTSDSCDAVLGCRNTPVIPGTPCDDGLYCTLSEICNPSGVCVGTPRTCGAPSEPCYVTECDESMDRCREVPNPDGTRCAERSVKPQMMVILDNSGTMSASTGVGLNTCGREHTRISDAKCVLGTVVNAYGDIVFGLERFRQTTSGSCGGTCPMCGTGATCPTTCSSCSASTIDCSSCNPAAIDPATGMCPSGGGTAAQGEILTPLVDDSQAQILRWVDYSCNSCSRTGLDPELTSAPSVYTPLAGSLRAARRYFEGGDPSFPSPVDPRRSCTPYYVILITDGTEACSTYADAVAAARELRTTLVSGTTFDIRTYTIGVGITPGSFSGDRLGEVATAGGTTPYFASDETSLSLAFAQILEDSLLVETCNGSDDDCDSLVDEGFTLYCNLPAGVTTPSLCVDPGDPCNNVDDNCTRGTTDEPRNACGVCGALPTEVCDRIDNDCDGMIDEPPADCSCIPSPELCDNLDNDCDGMIDDGLMRPCGFDVGACTRGTQVCSAGTWGMCSGTTGVAESCNGIDDDCDGVVDGVTRPCGPMAVGACAPGVEVCTAAAWGACSGAILPSAEICDGVDNDCNGTTDEADPGIGAPCETTCGPGTVQCVAGLLACSATASTGMIETCNAYDDDCDGAVDEDVATRGACTSGGLLCVPGVDTCLEGVFQCVGGAPPEPETCDCLDNDCNATVDEGVSCAATGAGAACLAGPYCTCARPCDPGEFPCANGYRCTGPAEPMPNFCVPDDCFDVDCPPMGDLLRECVAGACVPICDTVVCPAPLVCDPTSGDCSSDDCYTFPDRCPASSWCVSGECEPDACVAVTCDAGEFCRAGVCVGSCAGITCPSTERCAGGLCVADPCGEVTCSGGLICDPATGDCVDDGCDPPLRCPENTVCEPLGTVCVRDPCLGVTCATGEMCEDGECTGTPTVRPDAGVGFDSSVGQRVLAAGGGVCTCRVGAGPTSTGGLGLTLGLGLALALRARRRTKRAEVRR